MIHFFTKLWLIYKSNFSENDVGIFILPLFAYGIGLSLHRIVTSMRNSFTASLGTYRTEIVLLFYTAAFMALNYHEASSQIGFRLTLPVIVSLLFFSYVAIVHLRQPTQPIRSRITILALFAINIVAYIVSTSAVVYTSTLTTQGIIGALIQFKPYIYSAGFIVLAIVAWKALRTSHRWGNLLLPVLCCGLLILKFGPVWADYQLRTQTYGVNFSKETAETRLHEHAFDNIRIASNEHAYQTQYFTGDPRIANRSASPMVREFERIYFPRFFKMPVSEHLIGQLVSSSINYYWYSVTDKTGDELKQLDALVSAHPHRIRLSDEYSENNQVRWRIYEIIPPNPQTSDEEGAELDSQE